MRRASVVVSTTMREDDRAHHFLRERGAYHGDLDVLALAARFEEEMQRGLAGVGSSLRMIPTYIEAHSSVPLETPVIALDAGGTNLRVALVSFAAAGKPVLLEHRLLPMPGVDGEITSEKFFEVFAERLDPFLAGTDRVGLSFSFPTEILPDRDGRIIELCKEVKVSNAPGQLIGRSINAALRRLSRSRTVRVVVLNDTVGTLLAGTTAARAGESTLVGFVLGTGTNCAYIEHNDRIRKHSDLLPGGHQVVNVESGAYAAWDRGQLDLEFDATTTNPGHYVFEKAMAGAYLGPLCRRALVGAAEAGLFSIDAARTLRAQGDLSTSDLSPFLTRGVTGRPGLYADLSRTASAGDLRVAAAIVDGLVERAAKLAAVSLGAVLKRTCSGERAAACVTVDGSTFWRLSTFRERFVRTLDTILGGRTAYHLVAVDHAPIVGAAVAGLTNLALRASAI